MTDNELLQAIYNDMKAMKGDIHSMQGDIHSIQDNVHIMQDDIHTIQDNVHIMQDDIHTMQNAIHNLEGKVNHIELTLENETNRNIKIVAEGHLDLTRKLNEAIRISSDIKAKQEVQDVYINIHESKLRAL